jgi:hypothetical protein
MPTSQIVAAERKDAPAVEVFDVAKFHNYAVSRLPLWLSCGLLLNLGVVADTLEDAVAWIFACVNEQLIQGRVVLCVGNDTRAIRAPGNHFAVVSSEESGVHLRPIEQVCFHPIVELIVVLETRP